MMLQIEPGVFLVETINIASEQYVMYSVVYLH